MLEELNRGDVSVGAPNDLQSFWQPFTPNRQFKQHPRLVVSAKGLYYRSHDGRDILDSSAGLWCANLGHCHPKVVEAVQQGIATLDFAPTFQFGHNKVFELASQVAHAMPADLNRVFFCNSGSEAVDTALKIALAYHRTRGDAGRYRLIGRERAYHGVGFGGISVGGMVANRRTFGPMLNGVDHIRHTLDLEHNAFARGQPEWGAHLADDLERLCALHDPSTIAAVIVEPVAGSVGVYPPPVGYLERLRQICDRHGILLIFDEVITAWGRLGYASAAERFGITPDLITMAKGLTSAHVPMGAVVARDFIYEAFMKGPEHVIELFHGYTYSGHPIAAVAGLATLEAYKEEGVFEQVRENERYFEDALHSCRDLPHVVDVRNLGLMGAIELEPLPGQPGKRGFELMIECYERGLMTRMALDTFEFSPPLVIDRAHIDRIFDTVQAVLRERA
ncbi:MAG: aspartate aminotransferase family protein [Geminicoccaceae bacterium]|nr:aspartate aminotransferase family protein [Geminicoccaceae bacterium]